MATKLTRLDQLRSLRAANGDLAFATAFVTLTTGAFLVGFVQSLGGSAIWVNVLSAIPSLAGVLQLPGAVWGRGYASFKRFIAPAGWIWRAMYVPIVVLPLLPWPNELRLAVLMMSVALGSIVIMTVNSVYNDWLAEMVPSNSRGFYFARRGAIGTIVGALVGILGAVLLDAFRGAGHALTGFSLVFGFGLFFGLISMTFFMRMADTQRPNPVRQNLTESISGLSRPFRDIEFRRVLIFLAVATLGQTYAGNLYAAFGLQTLKLDYKVIQGTGVMQALGMVAFLRLWGFVSDKYGNKPVLAIAGLALSLNSIPWILCNPNNKTGDSILLLSTHPLMAIGWGAVGLCQFNLLLATAKEEDRASYIGAGLAVAALVGGVSPILGALQYDAMTSVVSQEWAYKSVFATTSLLRLASLVFLFPVKEEGARAIWQAVRDLRSVSPKGMIAMRTLATSSDVGRLEAAIDEVASERVNLASDTIIKALHDPQPRVRRRAAAALSRLQDPRAVEELIHQLEFHPDLVEVETIDALGRLGDARAIPYLVQNLQSPRSLLRRSSAHAIGRVLAASPTPSPDLQAASEALISAASDPYDPDLRRSGLQALRQMGAENAGVAISAAILDPWPSVRVAAAEAVADLEVREAAGSLREALTRYQDEAGAELAYALGAVGSLEDVPLILVEAERSVSIITRRRCLLGVARLFGVEAETYRLMLLEGMARDQAILQRGGRRSGASYRAAVGQLTAGDEAGALRSLADIEPKLRPLADNPVPEAALVAICAVRP